MRKSVSQEYYTYTYAYPENYPNPELAGTVFYVGKGKRDRIKEHLWEAKRGAKTYKCGIIREIWEYGLEVTMKKVFITPVEQDAYIYEWILINLIYGRENLANVCYGGNGRYAFCQGGSEVRNLYIPHVLIETFKRSITESISDYLLNLICFDLYLPLSSLRVLSREHIGNGGGLVPVSLPSLVVDKLYSATTRYHSANRIIEHLMCSDPLIVEALGHMSSWIETIPY